MDSKKNSPRRQKKPTKAIEENVWDCSVCTYRNTAEAFKCAMCDVRKGTSTRKPRLNPQLVAQQVAHSIPTNTPKSRSKESRPQTSSAEGKLPKKKLKNSRPKLKNVDRTQVHQQPVTVNNVTVVITEFQPKSSASQAPAAAGSEPSSSSNSHLTSNLNGEAHTSPKESTVPEVEHRAELSK